jgi:hypothetical protein
MAKTEYVRYINGKWTPCKKPFITLSNAGGRIETINDDGHFHSFDDKPSIVEDSGQCEWHQNGDLHRDGDKPALINHNTKKWYCNGLLHRENNLPASVSIYGEEWFKMGVRHRDDDGPAIIRKNGDKEWWINGIINQDDDHFSSFDRSSKTKFWTKEGQKHRDGDLPAIINNNYTIWMQNGKIHRDGIRPAYIAYPTYVNQVVLINGYEHYFKNNKRISFEELVLTGRKILRFMKYAVLRLKLYKLVTKKRLCSAITYLPPSGIFPGGDDYRKACERFSNNTVEKD